MNTEVTVDYTKVKRVQPNGFYGMTQLLIPAFTGKKQGLIISIAVYIKESPSLKITGEGHIAQSLEKLFKRTVEILSALKPSYKILTNFHFNLVSIEQGFRVKDVRSASLPICITLLNVLRQLSGKGYNQSIIGTGLLRKDGSFIASSCETVKEKAVMEKRGDLAFTNASHCSHVFELENLLNAC